MERVMRKRQMMEVYDALEEKGYNPVGQIAGYILTGDPAYITNHNGARNIISRIDREELLKDLAVVFGLDMQAHPYTDMNARWKS